MQLSVLRLIAVEGSTFWSVSWHVNDKLQHYWVIIVLEKFCISLRIKQQSLTICLWIVYYRYTIRSFSFNSVVQIFSSVVACYRINLEELFRSTSYLKSQMPKDKRRELYVKALWERTNHWQNYCWKINFLIN